MHILGCLDRPTAGRYVLNGRDVSTLPADELARVRNETIGFVFQGFNLLARTPAVENVELPLLYTRKGVVKATERRDRAMAALEAVGLTDRAEHHPNQLSGGQQQRVAIARALVTQPSLLLADEPTGNLDSSTSHEVMEIFASLREKRGITIVLITHERDIAAYGTRTVDFKDGLIVSDQATAPSTLNAAALPPRCSLRAGAHDRRACVIPMVDVALKALGRNRLQTALTMLGITVGVATVLAMMAVGAGAQRSIEQQVRAAGLNQITIRAGNWRPKITDSDEAVAHQGDARESLRHPLHRLNDDVVKIAFHPEDDPMEKHDHPTARQRLGDLEAGLGSAATMTFDDAEAIRELPGVQYVAGGIHENIRVHSGTKRWFTRMHGTDVMMPSIKRAWTFTGGRFFTEREQNRAEQVVVLGQVVADRLFGAGVNPVGQTVTMWSQPFEVVGVVTSATWVVQPAPGDDQFDAVYMPYTTTQRLLNLSKLNDITVTAESSGGVSRLSREITKLLRARHGIGDNDPDDFTIITQATKALTTGGLPPSVARAVAANVAELEKVTLEQLAMTMERASRTMTWLLAAVAAVSLLVGGIGIMNITLLSVTERTKEIGLRMAVGARGKDVMRQFLFEAMVISAAGGLLGIVIGVIASIAIARSLQWSTVVSPLSVLLAFGVAAAIGIFFGWYPARRAAQLDPIVALRHE